MNSSLEIYTEAIKLFHRRRFAEAEKAILAYRGEADYFALEHVDKRSEKRPLASVVIVSRKGEEGLLHCLDSLERESETAFETIVVNNGENDSVLDRLLLRDICLVQGNAVFTPSEGRNIGAAYARSELLIFLDDDALVGQDFVKSAIAAFKAYPFLGIRGRVLPKTSEGNNAVAGHYDIGELPIPAVLDIEGNMAVPKDIYDAVGGMNPLMFGSEGLELSHRLLQEFPGRDIYYWPSMTILHDFAQGGRLEAKMKRYILATEYFNAMMPDALKMRKQYLAWILSRPGTDMKTDRVIGESAGSEDMEKAELLFRISRLEKELEITTNSFALRLGRLLGQAYSSPWREGPLLPLEIFRLAREWRSGGKNLFRVNNSPRTAIMSIVGSELRNEKNYATPGKTEHVYGIFPAFRPLRKGKPSSSLRIACILGEHTFRCLEPDAHLFPLSENGWKEEIEHAAPQMLLVESLWQASDGGWKNVLATTDDWPTSLKDILAYCNERSIPAVFWNTEDVAHYPFFRNAAKYFEHIFAMDARVVSLYKQETNKPVHHLPPAVQPVYHNPVRSAENEPEVKGFTYLFDGWADLIEKPEDFSYLDQLCERGLHIVESRYRFRANKLDENPAYKKSIMGCLDYEQLLTAWRYYQVAVMSPTSLSTPLVRFKRAIEAVACGTPVLHFGKTDWAWPAHGIVQTENAADFKGKARDLIEDKALNGRLSHLGRRELYLSHTYAHRLKDISSVLGLQNDWVEYPKACVITPTKRPDLIPGCIEKFEAQVYPNKELIIIVNTTDAEADSIGKILVGRDNIKFFQLHQEKNIGACLNYGISQASGDYWFKMDDDDFYGKNYLLDTMIALRGFDDCVFGKPPGFVYFEENDKIFNRGEGFDGKHIQGDKHAPYISGATLGGKIGLDIDFSEEHRACVDSFFLETSSRRRGLPTYASDIFNFVAYRSRSAADHTWKVDPRAIKRRSVPFADGLDFTNIMI